MRPTGNLGGLGGADAICQNLANAAGLPGAYMAWLSDTAASPSTRFTQASVPYTLVNGTTVAANWAALTSGTLAHAIDLTESGVSSGGIQVWTNTQANGTPGGAASPGHCDNWTSANTFAGNVGMTTSVDTGWTIFGNRFCNEQGMRGLYCFQQR